MCPCADIFPLPCFEGASLSAFKADHVTENATNYWKSSSSIQFSYPPCEGGTTYIEDTYLEHDPRRHVSPVGGGGHEAGNLHATELVQRPRSHLLLQDGHH